jgi:hypothetical protein
MTEALYALAGFAAGYTTHALLNAPRKAIYLSTVRRFEATAPAITPRSHFETWQTWTHRFIAFAEQVAREQHRPPHRLPSYQAMRAANGHTWRTFRPYVQLLRQAQLVDVRERGGMRWLASKAERRRRLTSLPYPTDPRTRPPRFQWVTEVTRVTA